MSAVVRFIVAWLCRYAGALNPHNASDRGSPTPGEPTPVYENGLPGDCALVRYFIGER
eukprot:COSAG01_NODE_11886_length_1840_cov_155.260195_2_plen_58_part_00